MIVSKNIQRLIKIIVVILSFVFLYFKLKSQLQNFDYQRIAKFNLNYFLLFLAFALSFLNWGIESCKWQFLIRHLQKISFLQAFKGVVAGVTVSVFTPNRIGEFGGRILVLDRKNRISAIFATLLGSYSQLLATLTIGLSFSPIYFYVSPPKIGLEGINYPLLFLFTSVFLLVLLIIFFNINRLILFIKKEKYLKFVSFVQGYSRKELFKVLMISILRYAVFFHQFYFLLLFFNVEISWFHSLCGISLIYLLTSVVPIFSIFEFGVRGSLAIAVLGIYSPNFLALFSASLALWIINLALPAMVGALFIYKFKL